MKKEYLAPELELIELKNTLSLLAASDPEQVPGTGDPEEL